MSLDTGAIRARLDAATDGPWEAITTGRAGGDHWYVTDAGESIAMIHASDGEDEDRRQPDAEFIAHAPEDIAGLLTEVERLRGLANDYAAQSRDVVDARVKAEAENERLRAREEQVLGSGFDPWLAQHDAKVREQVAQDLLALAVEMEHLNGYPVRAVPTAVLLDYAARIAREGGKS